jgi:hypothetical protein
VLVALFVLMLVGPVRQIVSLHGAHGVTLGAVREWLAVIPNPWPWPVSASLGLAVLLVLGIGRQGGAKAPGRSEIAAKEADTAKPDPE